MKCWDFLKIKKKNIKKKGEQEYNWDERSLKIIYEYRYYY